jgi:hypothetical protein
MCNRVHKSHGSLDIATHYFFYIIYLACSAKIACVVVAMKTYLGLYFIAKYIGNKRPGDLWKIKPTLIVAPGGTH